MSPRQRFIRKIVYACVIAALLLPLSWLSQPETTETKGGVLAQMRSEHQLSQAQLGEIDPASETIKLATLGMRGVAANILWTKANEYKKTEDWVGYSAALEQIENAARRNTLDGCAASLAALQRQLELLRREAPGLHPSHG
jgi:hypothetical protein